MNWKVLTTVLLGIGLLASACVDEKVESPADVVEPAEIEEVESEDAEGVDSDTLALLKALQFDDPKYVAHAHLYVMEPMYFNVSSPPKN